jgi:BirA family biotin operon repressor/biotin-[acetyl-CoA-carboxylase] ligase
MKPDCLNGLPFVRKFIHLENIDSTNLFGRSLEDIPESGITVIQADNQSSGRGRLGNSFFSSHSGGLWVSIIAPISDLSRHFQFNRAISLAIHDSILKLFPDSPLAIKWPNDIYWAERKICGILLENHLFHPEFLVIGFGINVNIKACDFPPEIKDRATSVLIETGQTISRTLLLRSILENFHINLSADQISLHIRYLDHLYRKSSEVEIGEVRGVLHSVEVDGRLCIRRDSDYIYVGSGTLNFL